MNINNIFEGLLTDSKFYNSVLPSLKPEYFPDLTSRLIYQSIRTFYDQYGHCPKIDTLRDILDNTPNVAPETLQGAFEIIAGLDLTADYDTEYLIEQAEEHFKATAQMNALVTLEEMFMTGDPDSAQAKRVLDESLNLSFREMEGLEMDDDMESMMAFRARLKQAEEGRIPFQLKALDTITNGGLLRGTLTVVAAVSGGGKSMFMTSVSAAMKDAGKNVLYIGIEQDEDDLAVRIDQRRMKMKYVDYIRMNDQEFFEKRQESERNSKGKLYFRYLKKVKPSVNTIENILDEWKYKKGVECDIVFIDYIGIMKSDNLKDGEIGSYRYIEDIVASLKDLAMRRKIAVVSATQLNRSALNEEVGPEHIAGSMGTVRYSDLLFSITQNEVAKQVGLAEIKILKNRRGKGTDEKFAVGCDTDYYLISDADANAEYPQIVEEKPTKRGKTKDDNSSTKNFVQFDYSKKPVERKIEGFS